MKYSSTPIKKKFTLTHKVNSVLKFINFFSNKLNKEVRKINFFDIPNNEVMFFFKKSIFNTFEFKSLKFSKKNSLIYLPYYILIFVIYSFYIFFYKCRKKRNLKKYDLLIDNLESDEEVKLYKDLEVFLDKKKNIFRVTKKELSNDNKIFLPRFKNYNLSFKDFLNLYKILFKSIVISIKFKFNFVYYSIKLIDEVFYYENLFRTVRPKNIIMHQHYLSSNIKNYLFKKYDGKKTCLIQKNINTINKNGFFYDADIFFSIGKYTSNNNKFTKSRIQKNIPIGSIFMNRSKKDINKFYKKNLKKYDILCIAGTGLHPGSNYDTYQSYSHDYIETFNWLIKFKKKFPKLKIALKQRGSANNKFEENLLRKSKIDILNKNNDSYVECMKSKFLCSWCSTMIVEFKYLNTNSYFLDPGLRNDQFMSLLFKSKPLRINDYAEFERLALKALKMKKKYKLEKKYIGYNSDYNNVIKKVCLHLKII